MAWHAAHRAAGGRDQLHDLTALAKRTPTLGLDSKDIERLEGALCRFEIEAGRFVGTSAAARTVRAAAWRLCFGSEVYHALESQPVLRETHVLILGESGSGKELVARMLIAGTLSSDREAAPARVLNSAAVPASGLAGARALRAMAHAARSYGGRLRPRRPHRREPTAARCSWTRSRIFTLMCRRCCCEQSSPASFSPSA